MIKMRALTMITGNGPTVNSLFTGSKSSASRELVINFTIVKVPPELVSAIEQLIVSISNSL